MELCIGWILTNGQDVNEHKDQKQWRECEPTGAENIQQYTLMTNEHNFKGSCRHREICKPVSCKKKKVKKLLHLNNRMVNFLVLMYALSVFMLNIFSYLVHDNQWYSFAIKTVIVWELIAGTIANLHPPLKSWDDKNHNYKTCCKALCCDTY